MKHQIKQWNKTTQTKELVEVDVTPARAIRLFCAHECMDGQPNYVPDCTDPNCPLFPFRTKTATRVARRKNAANQNREDRT